MESPWRREFRGEGLRKTICDRCEVDKKEENCVAPLAVKKKQQPEKNMEKNGVFLLIQHKKGGSWKCNCS